MSMQKLTTVCYHDAPVLLACRCYAGVRSHRSQVDLYLQLEYTSCTPRPIMQATARTHRESGSPRVGLLAKYYARINSNISLVAPSQVVVMTCYF